MIIVQFSWINSYKRFATSLLKVSKGTIIAQNTIIIANLFMFEGLVKAEKHDLCCFL